MQPEQIPGGPDLRTEGDLNISPLRSSYQDTANATAREWLDRDADVFFHQALSTPCLQVITECSGSSFTDMNGRSYLDFHGNSVHQVGFGHPHVVKAIREQMDTLSFSTRRYTNRPAVLLAEKLVSLTGGHLSRVLLAPGGTLAIGMAIKLARIVTGRFKTISLWDSFHGASLDAIGIGGEAIFRHSAGPLMPGALHAPPPNPGECLWDCSGTCSLKCAGFISYLLEKEGDIAAVIAEPVRAAPVIPPAAYWQQVRAACDRHGALLIFDEIPNGLGRTGTMFAYEHYGIRPDILVLGKGLGGGIMPLAAMIARGDFNDHLSHTALGHYTHEKSPVACAAALAAIEVIESEDLLRAAREKGAYLLDELHRLQAVYLFIGELRGIGLLVGIVMSVPGSGEKCTESAEFVMYECLRNGLNFKISQGNILTLAPPLTISYEELDQAVAILDRAFGAWAALR